MEVGRVLAMEEHDKYHLARSSRSTSTVINYVNRVMKLALYLCIFPKCHYPSLIGKKKNIRKIPIEIHATTYLVNTLKTAKVVKTRRV